MGWVAGGQRGPEGSGTQGHMVLEIVKVSKRAPNWKVSRLPSERLRVQFLADAKNTKKSTDEDGWLQSKPVLIAIVLAPRHMASAWLLPSGMTPK